MIIFRRLSLKKTNQVQHKTLSELRPNLKLSSFEFTKINLPDSNFEISKKGQNIDDFSFQVGDSHIEKILIFWPLDVTKGSIAGKKGISVGDELISINGNKVACWKSTLQGSICRIRTSLRNDNYVTLKYLYFEQAKAKINNNDGDSNDP